MNHTFSPPVDDLDTSRARSAVLARIRAQQHRPVLARAEEAAQIDATLRERRRGPMPDVGHDAVQRFTQQALELQSTVAQVGSRRAVPAAIRDYLREHDLPMQAAAWNTLNDLDWSGAGLEVAFRACEEDDLVGFTEAFAGIAETGSLVLTTSAQMHASNHLYPETHVAVLKTSRICPHYEEVFDLLRSELGDLPRSVQIVSGPSRTGDIEQTIVLGAHGPYRVHVILVQDA